MHVPRVTDCITCWNADRLVSTSDTQCIFCRKFLCASHARAHSCRRDLFAWMREVGPVGRLGRLPPPPTRADEVAVAEDLLAEDPDFQFGLDS